MLLFSHLLEDFRPQYAFLIPGDVILKSTEQNKLKKKEKKKTNKNSQLHVPRGTRF